MKDTILLQLIQATIGHLKHAVSVSPALQLIPSYNAVLSAAKANHPEDTFLKVLLPLEPSGEMISIAEMTALFAQIGIVLEANKAED
ncbi:MAG: hypothetical protein QM758_17715 [Armatimonas sp.]